MNKKQNHIVPPKTLLHVSVRAIGNSRGVVIPKMLLKQLGVEGEMDMELEGEKIILTKPKNTVRQNWANDAKAIALAGDNKLITGDFNNENDGDWAW
jgi:antitoxin MazE